SPRAHSPVARLRRSALAPAPASLGGSRGSRVGSRVEPQAFEERLARRGFSIPARRVERMQRLPGLEVADGAEVLAVPAPPAMLEVGAVAPSTRPGDDLHDVRLRPAHHTVHTRLDGLDHEPGGPGGSRLDWYKWYKWYS